MKSLVNLSGDSRKDCSETDFLVVADHEGRQEVSKKPSWRARCLAVVLLALILIIQVVNFDVYQTTKRSSESIQVSSTWLTNLATLQSDGFAWSGLYNHLDRADVWDDIRNRRADFGEMQNRLIADPSTEGEVRNDLEAIQFLLPDIDRLNEQLTHSSGVEFEDTLHSLRAELDLLNLRTNRLFDREQDRYVAETAAIASANKLTQKGLLIASGISAFMGLGLLIMFWRQARSDLRRAYRAVVSEARVRESAEHALRESETRYRSVLANVNEVIFECDSNGHLSFLTPNWENITGVIVEDSLGKHFSEFVRPDDRDRTLNILNQAFDPTEANANEHLRRFETCILSNSGETKWVEVRCNAAQNGDGQSPSLLGTLHDVSDRQKLEAQLRQAQKLESVGSLAAGIAHEINTPIQFIGDNLTFLGEAFKTLTKPHVETDESSPSNDSDLEFFRSEVPEAIEQAAEGISRVATIVNAMKAFGHPDGASSQFADLNEALETTATVGRSEYRSVADLELDLGELPRVSCHRGELNQVFLNFIVNSAHAIEAVVSNGERGKITIKTRRDGDHIVIEFSDTGCGISSEITDRIFDPFFTTKEVGKGTGQGLSLARSVIVDRHGGSIEVSSEVGKGTTFRLRLPVQGVEPTL